MKAFDINGIQLKIQSPNVTVDDSIRNYIFSQIEKLGKTYGRFDRCEVMLKADKNNVKKNCRVEAKLFVPGNVLFANDKRENFRAAVKKVFDDLHNQLYKFKDRLTDKTASSNTSGL